MGESELDIELHEVSRAFSEGERRKTVLDRVNFSAKRGESIAIRGRSGSGKSTLLNLIGGIDAPDSGTVVVAGEPLTTMSERQRTFFRRRQIGFVYQAFNLIQTLSVADNIRLVLELNDTPRRDVNRRITDLLHAVGLSDRGDSYPDVLSGGEQQRVAVARALANSPRVLIADEPTGNLDDDNAERVMALLKSLSLEYGSTMLIATHSARLAGFCDRIVQLAGGHLTGQLDE